MHRQSRRKRSHPVTPGDEIICDIPYDPPVTEVEVALVLNMLADQIDVILQADDVGEIVI
jgi:hypothetical protein